MPSTYPHGTPAWVDLRCPNPDGAATFYSALFGWNAEPPIPDSGGYRMFTLGGRLVAGFGPEFQPGMLPWWSTYVAVDSARSAAKAANKSRGQVHIKPTDMGDFGKVAVVADPAGAAFAVWQGNSLAGAEVIGEVGSLARVELNTRDLAGAKAFYGAVLGWTGEDRPWDGPAYVEWHSEGRAVGGMMLMDERWPAEVPPHWLVYFRVEDVDATVRQAEQLGGKVAVQPLDLPPGRAAVLQDLDGAVFAVISPRA